MSDTPLDPQAPASDERRRRAEERLSFLFPPGEPARFDEPGKAGGALHRFLAFASGVACSHLMHERVIDEQMSQAFRAVLRDPSVSASARLLETLVAGRKVRAADLLGIVPPESSRSLAVTAELRELLRALRRELDDESVVERDEGEPSAADLLVEFVLQDFEGEMALSEPGAGPRSLAAASRPGPLPEEGPAAFLLSRDGSRQPLHPFVTGTFDEAGARFAMLWDFEGGRLRQLGTDGSGPEPLGRGFLPDFFLEFLLKMGAYGEVREWLKGMSSEERASLNRRNILYAGFCHYGSLYLRQREFQQAVVELEKAVKIRPDLVLAHLYLAQACMSQKQFDRAIDILKRHAVLFNRSDRIFELIGDCYRQKKDVATALRMYEKAASLNAFNSQVEKKRALLKDEIKQSREQEPAAASSSGLKLDELLVDMTLEAELGMYQNTVGREQEVRQLVEVLSCRDKRNALLLGEPGVGKTALVEDFVLRLVQRRLPERLHGKKVYLMSVATLLAGAKFRGQFEERVLELVKVLKSQDCILFIDNLHNIVNAGLTRGGTLDTSNLLKPHLVRGEIQVVGATSHEEYRTNLEKDQSLMRCFQTVVVDEPSLEAAADMVVHVRSRYEEHHRVVLPEAVVRATLPVIDACVRERALPDKAIDVLDRACAVASLRRAESGDDAPEFVELTREDVLSVLAEMTRIPVARLTADARTKYAKLEGHLSRRVIGQEDAVRRVAKVLRAARTGLVLNERRPKGVFLFVGPTGVGKTELARAMAELLFGSDERLVRIDMSEYMEKINQSRLIGTAPGYVGYNDQNQLTDEVRKNPHSLVLLDEIEKADANMLNLFLQVFDAGRLTDGKGRTVHFSNTTMVMTSNVGTELFSRPSVGYEEGRGQRGGAASSDLLRQVKRTFTPEFLNRIDEVICFEPLVIEDVRRIARQKLALFEQRLAAQDKRLEVTPEAEELIAREGYSFDQGARNLERTIRRLVLEPLSERALGPDWERGGLVRASVSDGRMDFEVLPDPRGEALGVEEAAAVPFEDSTEEG